MLRYKSFVFGQVDSENVDLFQYQEKEIMKDAGRGKGRGTPTGKFETRLEPIGHFNSVGGCLYKMFEMELASAANGEEVKEANVPKMVSDKIDEFRRVLYAVKGKLIQEPTKAKKEEEMEIEDLKV